MNARSFAPALLANLAIALAQGPAASHAAPDPFYYDRLRDGIQAAERNDFVAAAKQLRIACFGLLDDPTPLAACLTRLAVAQGATGDGDGFLETFRRIAEVEQRFGAYGKADLPPEVRAAFVQRVLTAIPAASLDSMPAWKELSRRKLEAQMAALAPRERRRQLEARLAKDPKNVTLQLLQAELDLAEGKTGPAASRAEQAVTLAPRDAWALCLRGLTRASAKRCADAVADLESCTLAAHDPRYAKALQGCQAELAKASPAKPAAAKAAPAKPGAAAAAGKPLAASPAKPPAALAAPLPPVSAAEREAFDRSHRLLLASGSADVKQALQLASGVADAHPEWQEAQFLAAEAAYRNSRWKEAASYFKRGGEPGDDQPEMLFYMAVSLYETGDRPAAAQALKRAISKLQSTPFVDSYVKRILGH